MWSYHFIIFLAYLILCQNIMNLKKTVNNNFISYIAPGKSNCNFGKFHILNAFGRKL